MTDDREKRIQRRMKKCQHFDGVLNKECKAGIPYSNFQGQLPCVGSKNNTCEKFEGLTRAQVIKEFESMDKSIERMMKAMPFISDWREKKPIGKAEIVECPICKGNLHLSQAKCNGHVHGRCETPNCLAFME